MNMYQAERYTDTDTDTDADADTDTNSDADAGTDTVNSIFIISIHYSIRYPDLPCMAAIDPVIDVIIQKQ